MSDQTQAELEWEFTVGRDLWGFLLEGTSQTAQLMEAEGHRLTGFRYESKVGRAARKIKNETLNRRKLQKGWTPSLYTNCTQISGERLTCACGEPQWATEKAAAGN